MRERGVQTFSLDAEEAEEHYQLELRANVALRRARTAFRAALDVDPVRPRHGSPPGGVCRRGQTPAIPIRESAESRFFPANSCPRLAEPASKYWLSLISVRRE